MERYIKLLFVALFATMSFALTSCGDDNDEPDDPNDVSLVGTWKHTINFSADWWQTDYTQIKNDGTYITITDVYCMGYSDVSVEYGKWNRDGNKLTVKADDPSDEGIYFDTATIKKLTKTELVLSAGGLEYSFTRVDDSIIEEYL